MTATGSLTVYGRELLVTALFSEGVALPSLWLGLLLVSPDINDTGDSVYEVPAEIVDPETLVASPTGYSRLLVPATDNDGRFLWSNRGGGTISYGPALSFAEAKANWGTVMAWGLFTAQTSGQMFACGPAGFDVQGPGDPIDEDDVPVGDVVVLPENGIVLGNPLNV